MKSVKFGLVGLGGYAGAACDVLLACHDQADHPVEFVAACEPDLQTQSERAAPLRERGMMVAESLDELLAQPIDAVWLPLPIQLHRPFTERALAAGKAVLCEKPAAGCVDDVDAMITARDAANLPVGIGFQDTWDPASLRAKRAILSGAIGQVIAAGVHACWPRHESYFNRSPWAGVISMKDQWVLDSPTNNALAHYINLPLFLLGSTEDSSADVRSIEAELYRVNPIENYDTASMRVSCKNQQGDVPLTIHMTHACDQAVNPIIVIQGTTGCVRWAREAVTIETTRGVETIDAKEDARPVMLRRFCAAVRGETMDDAMFASLEIARAHTVVINGASQAATITQVPDEVIHSIATEHGELRTIPGIEQVFADLAASGEMLHESKRVQWSQPAARIDLEGYDHFAGPASSSAPEPSRL